MRAEYKREDGYCLKIRENKQGLRGSLYDNYGKMVATAMFYFKDNDATTYRVKEYFGF